MNTGYKLRTSVKAPLERQHPMPMGGHATLVISVEPEGDLSIEEALAAAEILAAASQKDPFFKSVQIRLTELADSSTPVAPKIKFHWEDYLP